MKRKIGVIGSAAGNITQELRVKARDIGKEIARYGCDLLCGATTGLSYEAVLGAKEEEGFTLGFSPAVNKDIHVNEYGLPVDNLDNIIFTGMGFKGRVPIFIRSCDGVIGMSGRWGTLTEYATAVDEKKVIGVLTGTGGISDMMKAIEEVCSKKGGKKGGELIYNNDPKNLVNEVTEMILKTRW